MFGLLAIGVGEIPPAHLDPISPEYIWDVNDTYCEDTFSIEYELQLPNKTDTLTWRSPNDSVEVNTVHCYEGHRIGSIQGSRVRAEGE